MTRTILTLRMLLFSACLIATAHGQGFVLNQPQNAISVYAAPRNNVFYVGQPVQFALSGTAATYQVRDYYGTLIDQGPINGTTINVNAVTPGWYKLYVYGTQDQGAPYGNIVGGTMFCIFRNESNFPTIPSASAYPINQYIQDEVMRDITAMGPQRYEVQDASNPDGDIALIQNLIAIDALFYPPTDPVRLRPLMIAFPGAPQEPRIWRGSRRSCRRFRTRWNTMRGATSRTTRRMERAS